jgi:hypothetical protein
MLTVKFFKYERSEENVPNATAGICVREAEAIHVRYEADMRAVVQCGDAPGETFEATVGEVNCAYQVAYIMNEAGRTIETVR